MNKKMLSILAFMIFFGISYAGVGELINNVCFQIRNILPLISVILLVIAGLIYAIGKVLGQEYRSKTESWATTIIIGAVLGLILGVSAPFIVKTICDAMGLEGNEYLCEEMME